MATTSSSAVESPVLQAAVQGASQIRELVLTLPVNGVLTPVLMQVVVVANPDGTLLDLNLVAPLREVIAALHEVRKELMINNKLMTELNNRGADADEEWRSDPDFGSCKSIAGT